MSGGTITIRKWTEFQHYKKRSPPWVKVHGRLLDDPESRWPHLSDFAARFLVELWLLARHSEGVLVFDSLILARDTKRTSADVPRIRSALEELHFSGFIKLVGDDGATAYMGSASGFASKTVSPEEQRYRGTEEQSAVADATDAGASVGIPVEREDVAWKAHAAQTLRANGVPNKAIGDAIKNWWAVIRETHLTDAEITALVTERGARMTGPWNPAQLWNVDNPDTVTRLRYHINRMQKQGVGDYARRIAQ